MKLALKLSLVILVLFGLSCKKEDDTAKQKMALVTKAGWLTLKVEEKNADGTWKDITVPPLTTEADDLFLFRTDGSYEINEGPTKLPGSPQVISTGTWTFIENATKIQIINGNLMQIAELTDTKLQVVIAKVAPAANQRYTFGHP